MSNHALDHVGVAVPSLEEACRLFEVLLGATSSPPEVLETQGVRIAFVGAVELLEPLGPDTTIGRFLARRGPGLHHFAYRTDDIERELARLETEGLELVDRVPRPGANGHLVAFLHPSSTQGVLIELVEHSR